MKFITGVKVALTASVGFFALWFGLQLVEAITETPRALISFLGAIGGTALGLKFFGKK